MSIEELLRETLEAQANRVRGLDDLAKKVIRQAHSRRMGRAMFGLAALVIVMIVVILTINQVMARTSKVFPDPRGTAEPSVSQPSPVATPATGTSDFRIVEGPRPTELLTGGAVNLLPRGERRGQQTWFVAPGVSLPLPTGAPLTGLQATAFGWVFMTLGSTPDGASSDPVYQVIAVSREGATRSLATGAVRSMAVSPDGTQLADVQIMQSPLSVHLVVRQISDGKLLRTVALPAQQPSTGAYPSLVWTSDGIVASDPYYGPSAPGAALLIQGQSVKDLAPITHVLAIPGSSDVMATTWEAGRTCVRREATLGSVPTGPTLWCGEVNSVMPLGNGLTLITEKAVGGVTPTEAFVVNERTQTVAGLTLAADLRANVLQQVVADAGSTVLVPDLAFVRWIRWDVVTNTVELAAYPDGTTGVITW